MPTQQTRPHSAHWFMRGPGPNFRAAKFTDPVDGEVLGYTIAGVWGRADRTIWTDGRAHPSARAEHTWPGFSTAVCDRGIFTVTTTHMKFGYHRRNGVPASTLARMTEHYIRATARSCRWCRSSRMPPISPSRCCARRTSTSTRIRTSAGRAFEAIYRESR